MFIDIFLNRPRTPRSWLQAIRFDIPALRGVGAVCGHPGGPGVAQRHGAWPGGYGRRPDVLLPPTAGRGATARHVRLRSSPTDGEGLSLCHFPWPVIRASRRSVIAELFEDVRAVRGDGGLGDVVLLDDLPTSVPELGGGAVGVGFLIDQGGDGFAEGVVVTLSRPVSARACRHWPRTLEGTARCYAGRRRWRRAGCRRPRVCGSAASRPRTGVEQPCDSRRCSSSTSAGRILCPSGRRWCPRWSGSGVLRRDPRLPIAPPGFADAGAGGEHEVDDVAGGPRSRHAGGRFLPLPDGCADTVQLLPVEGANLVAAWVT